MEDRYIEDIESLDTGNFWFRAKQRYLEMLIAKPGGVILDVGCGGGWNLVPFIERGFTAIGVDRSERALELSRAKGYETFRADLEKEPITGLDRGIDYITALDFLEHVNQPVEVLRHLHAVARSTTTLIVTVPAYPWLYGRWDEAMEHVKRYTRRTLRTELAEAGWHVTRATYSHVALLPPAVLVRKVVGPLRARLNRSQAVPKESFFRPGRLFNAALGMTYLPEFIWFRGGGSLPFGLSVLAVAHTSPRPSAQG